MLRSRGCSKSIFVKPLALFAALLVPGLAQACPPPKTPLTGDQFYLCFDAAPRLGPQPILDADKGPFLVVEAELNGHKLPALLDTGAQVSAIDAAAAKELGLTTNGTYEITALDGRKTQGFKAPIDHLVIGGLTRYGGWLAVTDLSAVERAAAQPFSMILGADILSQVALGVSRDKQALTVMPNTTHVKGAGWMAPLHLQQPGNVLTTDISVDGHPLTVRVDTGLEGELNIDQAKWSEILSPEAHLTTMIGFGAAGPFVEPLVRLHNVKLGEEAIVDAIATEGSDGAPGGSDGALGMGFLSRFNFFLNPKDGTMFISRPQKPVPPRRETMAGIVGLPTDEGLTIAYVMAHSPAEAAGLKEGDRICTVDGEQARAAWVGTPKNDWMIGPAGKTVTLGRCGGGMVRLTLRRFY